MAGTQNHAHHPKCCHYCTLTTRMAFSSSLNCSHPKSLLAMACLPGSLLLTKCEKKSELKQEPHTGMKNGQEDNDHNVQASGGTAEHAQDETALRAKPATVTPSVGIPTITVSTSSTKAGFSTDDVEVVF
uniref:Secreted protein n=1 Tax=Macrostomum lignano TaxID=282301 RepID=A0A1I8FRS8_9PLAT